MSRVFLNSFVICFLSTLANAENQNTADLNCNHDRTSFRCVKYIRTYDGDTFTVDIPNVHPLIGDKIRIRVRGIDVPEIRTKSPCEKKLAIEAKNLTATVLQKAKTITLSDVGRDMYFRILATVYADGQSIKNVLLEHHLAYLYDGKTKPLVDWCSFAKKKN